MQSKCLQAECMIDVWSSVVTGSEATARNQGVAEYCAANAGAYCSDSQGLQTQQCSPSLPAVKGRSAIVDSPAGYFPLARAAQPPTGLTNFIHIIL